MLKAFKMRFLRKKQNINESKRVAGPDDYRAMLQRFKGMLRTLNPIDMKPLESSELLELERDGVITNEEAEKMKAIEKGYAKNGRALWECARSLIKELPEAERAREMDEVKRLLARGGFRESVNEAR